MERNANYTLVGFVALALMVAGVVFAIWLGRYTFNRDYDVYQIEFLGPVRGLTKGAEVDFNGIKVGEVTKLGLKKTNPNIVVADIQVNSDVPVRVDSYATLEPQGITFVSIVQITAGSPNLPLLKDRTRPGEIPLIRSQSSALSEILAGGGNLLQRAVEALDRVNKVLSDKNVANFNGSLEDISVITASVRENTQVIEDARAALQSIDIAAKSANGLMKSGQGLVDNDAKKVLTQVSDTAAELKAAAADARATVQALKGPSTDFATNTLPQVQSAIISLQSAAQSLERLSNEIEQNPRSLITKEPAKEIEVKP